MDATWIAHYTKLPEHLVRDFLRRPAAEVYRDQQYIRALYRLDLPYLRATLPVIRAHYEAHLDEFAVQIERRYHIARGAMSAYTLGNWVVAFLDFPEYALNMLESHSHLPPELFEGGLQDLLALLETLPEGREQWQQALCLLAFPLMRM